MCIILPQFVNNVDEKKIIWEKNYNNTVVLQAQNKTPKISHRNLKKL